MYVNERTLDYGPDGREAVSRLLEMGYNAGVITEKPRVDWVEVPDMEVAKKA
jgi:1,4-dihydroxy-6-naphthoate synthase